MSKKKACKNCKLFFEGDKCPGCGFADPTTTWQGRLYIHDAQRSQIAEKIGVKAKGEYAIKVR